MANFMSESARNEKSNQTEWAKTIKQMSPISRMQRKGRRSREEKSFYYTLQKQKQ